MIQGALYPTYFLGEGAAELPEYKQWDDASMEAFAQTLLLVNAASLSFFTYIVRYAAKRDWTPPGSQKLLK